MTLSDARPPQSALTAGQIAEIRARADAATKGPWSDQTNGVTVGENKEIWSPHGICVGIAWHYSSPVANAAFIAHARDDVPRLLAAISAAEQERDALREALDEVRARCHVQLHGGSVDGATPAAQCGRWLCDIITRALPQETPDE